MESFQQLRGRQSSRSNTKKSNKGMHVFTSYFRKRHQREAEKKEEARRVYEEKQKEVLRAAKFSEEEEERLQELKRHKKWKKIQKEQQMRFKQLQKKILPQVPESRPVTASSSTAPFLARRELGSQLSPSQPLSPDTPRAETFAQRSMEAVHRHTWAQRVAVMGTLMILLFISLHADVLGRRMLRPLLFLDNKYVPWYVIVLKDCGMFCHMSICSLIHFALCDISLIYAFESMELGTKTGPVVKKFYREKVHVAVAALSGGIVAFSICKALLMAWYRMLRDLVGTVFTIGRDSCCSVASICQALWSIPDTFLSGLQKAWALTVCTWAAMQSASPSKWVSSAYARVTRAVTGICIWVVAQLISFKEGKDDSISSVPEVSPLDDNATIISGGEENAASLDLLSSILNETLDINTTTLEETFNATLERLSILTSNSSIPVINENGESSQQELYWRNDAFETCRYVLTHSAVFLVALLVAFNILAKSYRYKSTSGTDDDQDRADISVALSSIRTSETLAKDEHLATNLSMETTGTIAETVSTVRPSSITVTIPVSRESYYGGSRSSRGTSRGSRRSS